MRSLHLPPPPSAFPSSRCWAEVDGAALRHNAAVARELAGPGATLLAVVKADGYGHGMIPVAHALAVGGDVAAFGVASVAEAAHLQTGFPHAAITLFSPALPAERREAVRLGVLPWISTVEEARDYARATEEVRGPDGEPFAVEIKVDTGMGRMGVLESGLAELRRVVAGLPVLRLVGIVTHLPMADEDEAFNSAQMDRFRAILEEDADGGNGEKLAALPRRHAQNSAGMMVHDRDGCNVARPGLMLYGSSPFPAFQARLRPALTLKTRVSLARDLPAGHGISYGRTFVTPRPMRVGTLAAGYADGYPRHLSNAGAEVLIRGCRCAVLGRVTMDQIMVDLSAAPGSAVSAGEEVVLIGRQDGEGILASELAEKAGTIAWEIFTGLTPRVARVYSGI